MSTKATPEQREANIRALSRMKRLFPALPKSQYGEFLINCTAFPFNGLPEAMKQCDELSRRAHKDVSRAYRIAYDDLNRAMSPRLEQRKQIAI